MIVDIFREIRRTLKPDGTVWLNIGDMYCADSTQGSGNDGSFRTNPIGAHGEKSPQQRKGWKKSQGLKQKDLIGIPWKVAFALRDDGWFLRCDIVWNKPNAMPDSTKDRPTKAHEYIFLLSKNSRYYYDKDSISEPAHWNGKSGNKNCRPRVEGGGIDAGINSGSDTTKKNKRSVWTVPTRPYSEAHFAVFPTTLVEPCVLAGCPPGGTVLDPFMGSGTTGIVAARNGRKAVGIELSQEYINIAVERIKGDGQTLIERVDDWI